MRYTLLIILTLILAFPTDSWARRSSSSSKSSYSKPAKSYKSKAPSKANIAAQRAKRAKEQVAQKKVLSAKRTAHTTKQLKPADKKLYEAAKSKGTSYKSKADAAKAFKSKNPKVASYTSKYKKKPATRPSYIPSSYTPRGSSRPVTVIYNQSHGGFGYMSGSSWIYFDPVGYEMRRSHYYYTPSYVTPYRAPRATVVHRESSGAPAMLFIGLIVIVLFIVLAIGIGVANRN